MKATKHAKREAGHLFRACLVNGVLDEGRALEAVRQIVAARPRGYFATLSYFRRLVELDRAQHTASVESALPLPADLQAGVQTSLADVYGPGLSISFSENHTLIGGMRIQVGSDVYDRSVRARLAALEQSF
jgi:F-type H+-transporting ATPase subunit delta